MLWDRAAWTALVTTGLAVSATAFLLATPRLETPQRVYTLRVCNDGPRAVTMAYVAETGRSLLALAFGAQPAAAMGWFEVNTGDCRDFDFETIDRQRRVWLTFTSQNPEGDTVGLSIKPDGRGSLTDASGLDLCFDRTKTLERSGTIEDVLQCPALADHPIEVSLTTLLTIPARTTGSSTFTVDSKEPWRILYCPHRGLPVPSKAATVNATVMGLPAVRWFNERRWYVYDEGKPIALWHPVRHNMSLAYYNFDRPAQRGVTAQISALIPQLRVRPGPLAARVNVNDKGRLYVTENHASGGERSDTANLAALDIESAAFSTQYQLRAKLKGQNPTAEQLAENREVVIRCRTEAPGCVTDTRNTTAAYDLVTIATDEADLAAFRATLQKIARLFPTMSGSLVHDATCKCMRVALKPN